MSQTPLTIDELRGLSATLKRAGAPTEMLRWAEDRLRDALQQQHNADVVALAVWRKAMGDDAVVSLLCPGCCKVRPDDGSACPHCGVLDTAVTIESAVLYHRAFTEAQNGQPPRYVLTPDTALLPATATKIDTVGRPITFPEARQLAIQWSAEGAHVTIRLRGEDWAYPPHGGRGKSVDTIVFEAYTAIGAREFVDAMVEAEASDDELPF